MTVKFYKTNQDGEQVTSNAIFRSKNNITTKQSQLEEQIATAFQEINAPLEQFQREGSGWIFKHIVQVDINVAEYQPLMGSSYIPLPKQLSTKKAIVNVQNKDAKCFLWSVLAPLHPADQDGERSNKYVTYQHELNTTGIEFLTPVTQLTKFEKLNISINVFGFEKEGRKKLLKSTYCSSQRGNINIIVRSKISVD